MIHRVCMGNVWVQRPAVGPEIREGCISYLPSIFLFTLHDNEKLNLECYLWSHRTVKIERCFWLMRNWETDVKKTVSNSCCCSVLIKTPIFLCWVLTSKTFFFQLLTASTFSKDWWWHWSSSPWFYTDRCLFLIQRWRTTFRGHLQQIETKSMNHQAKIRKLSNNTLRQKHATRYYISKPR